MLKYSAGKRIRDVKAKEKLLFIVLPFFLLYLSPSAFAARPLTTDDAGTVEKEYFQVEVGFDAFRQDNHDREYNPSLTLTYGVLERMDLAVGSGYLFVHSQEGKRQNGLSDSELKLKFRPIDEKGWIPAFALTGILKIPTASKSKGLGSGQTDFSINAILTKNLGERLAIHLNLGYTFIGEDRVNNELNYGLAYQFILSDKLAIVGEVTGMNNHNGVHGDDPLSGFIGAYYLITKKIIWDAGLEIGMNRAAPDFRFTTGVTWLFKL